MQTLTFIQKLLRQRNFLASLIPLFALFVGLSASHSAQAQATYQAGQITLNVKGANQTLNTLGSAASATNFFGRNFGSFNINTDQFSITGTTFTIRETGSDRYEQGELLYRVFPESSTSLPAFTSVALGSGVRSGNERTFTLTNARIDLLALVTTAGTPGTVYRFDVVYRVTNTSTLNSVISSPIQTSQFTATGARVAPTTIGNSNAFINPNGTLTGNTTYGASSGTTPLLQGANLGSYDINTGQLTLNGGNATTFESGGDAVQSARLVYRVIKPAQNGDPAVVLPLSNIALTQVGEPAANNGGFTRTFSNTTALRNLIAGLAANGIGTYNLIVSFEADVLRNGTVITVRDDNGAVGYTASFTTTGVPIQANTWLGTTNDDWFNPANWSLGRLPDANTNVVVPDFAAGSGRQYPNIFSESQAIASNGAAIDNRGKGPALSRDVVLQGSSQAQRSIARLRTGRWKVYGSFDNTLASYIQDANTVFELAGAGNQSITGGNFDEVEISGGGTKRLLGVMRIATSLTFLPNGGMLTTDTSLPDANYVELASRSTNTPNGAQLLGETDISYLRGFVQTNRSNVEANERDANGNPDPRTFGNIGMTLFFTGTSPGDVLVTRNTAENYTPLVNGTNRYGIRRIFGVRPSIRAGVVATMTFRYLDSETVNLGPLGDGSIAEPNLTLFLSNTSGNQFANLGRDNVDTNTNILTKTGVSNFATFTLGDQTAPLPVTLLSFNAKRMGTDALLTWETAIELNSKGFEVQVSSNGKEYRTVGFVSSESPNSTRLRTYTYLDTEKNKSGQRYYRLRQVDLDGKEAYFTPRMVSFDGQALAAALTAYPNPLGNADKLFLTVQSAVSGQGRVSITDMTGRVVSQQQFEVAVGTSDATINNLGDLKGGLYMVRLVLPNGEVKNLKVLK